MRLSDLTVFPLFFSDMRITVFVFVRFLFYIVVDVGKDTQIIGLCPNPSPKALFSWQNFGFLATVALSFLFDKHCPITE